MVYLIIVMSIALVVGSLMWILPSPDEKRLARLRANAGAANFHPKFIKYENYLKLIPSHLKNKQAEPKRQLLRYLWQGQSPLVYGRTLQFVFSDQKELLSFRVEGREADSDLKARHSDVIALALAAANYFQSLLALECKDEEGKRTLALYWAESGDIDLIDFNSQQIRALQSCL